MKGVYFLVSVLSLHIDPFDVIIGRRRRLINLFRKRERRRERQTEAPRRCGYIGLQWHLGCCPSLSPRHFADNYREWYVLLTLFNLHDLLRICSMLFSFFYPLIYVSQFQHHCILSCFSLSLCSPAAQRILRLGAHGFHKLDI